MSEKLLTQCIQEQDSQLLQRYINSDKLTLKNKNLVRILYFLDNLYWKENQKINIDFFECLLKNNIPLDSYLSKENQTTAIEKIILDIENNRNTVSGIYDDISRKHGTINEFEVDKIKELKVISKYQKYETILEKILYLLVKYGTNPNAILDFTNFGDNTTLLEYAYLADKELFKLLVNKGADINIQYITKSITDLPQTPLSKAIADQDIEIIKLLIKYNVEIDFWSYYTLFTEFETYYLWSIVDKIKYNSLDSIRKSTTSLANKIKAFEDKTKKFKLDKKLDDLFEILNFLADKIHIHYTFRHKSIFDLAIEAGDYKTIEFFLKNKIDELEKVELLDSKDKLNNMSENLFDSAHSMISYQEEKKFKSLEKKRQLENNSYLKKYFEDSKNKPSVSKALNERDVKQFKNTITKEIAEFLTITDLIKEDYTLKFIQIAIDNGSDINFQDNNGKTALILACELNKIEITKYLLSKNIDLSIEDENLKKAIQYVQDYELVKLFLVSLKNQHHPKKLVRLLANFTIDKPIKYTTHNWDFGELKKEYKNFDGYMDAVKKQFESIKNELEELSPNLYKKVYTFLLETNPDENYSWCHNTPINMGWSSLDGLQEWCDSGNKPESFTLKKPIYYEEDFETRKLTKFKDIINLFKQEIEIRANFNNLENLFANQVEALGSHFNLDLSAAKLSLQFYTDVEKFSNTLDRIFADMGARKACSNIKVTTKELDDRSIEIKITQIDSHSSLSSVSLLQRAKHAGDIFEINNALTNLCDWSVESSFEDESFRVNFLHSNNVKDIEILETKPRGFTHILRFYK